ncbi:MAG: hypothetical protein NPIRA03_06300 [Nitrospirales bacterium]|nr:MAG: hypothetical protein NPIRA03_06300 [Nitrospirales bacterium]
MTTTQHNRQWLVNWKIFMTFAFLVGIPGFAWSSDLAGHAPADDRSATTQIQNDHHLDKGHRLIEGVVEEVNENTIRVDAGEAGEVTPRYLNLSNSQEKEDFKIGDMVQIEVNAQNKVVNFHPVHQDGAKQ